MNGESESSVGKGLVISAIERWFAAGGKIALKYSPRAFDSSELMSRQRNRLKEHWRRGVAGDRTRSEKTSRVVPPTASTFHAEIL